MSGGGDEWQDESEEYERAENGVYSSFNKNPLIQPTVLIASPPVILNKDLRLLGCISETIYPVPRRAVGNLS